jgi:CRISPR/Cas system-associated exonuclease Cas4 (RecB family)
MRSGLTREWLLDTAYKVFVSSECARKITKAQRKHVHATELMGIKPRSNFGRCPDLTEGSADSNEAAMGKAEAAKKRKELASESAREQLAEDMPLAVEPAILGGPVEQADLVQDGGLNVHQGNGEWRTTQPSVPYSGH